MSSNEIFNNDELRARINFNLTEETIKRIYFEETGKMLTSKITIYHSKDYMGNFDIGLTGFDGTISLLRTGNRKRNIDDGEV